MTIKMFKKALKQMLADGEYDVCIRNAKFREKKQLKRLKLALENTEDIENIPIWALLYEIKSPLLLKDIITYMIMLDEKDSE